MRIHPKQIRIIKMAQRQLGISDDDHHDALELRYGVRSSTRLSMDQANDYIDDLQSRGFVLTPTKPRKPNYRRPKTVKQGKNVVTLASPAEIDKVNNLVALVRWNVENGHQRFFEKRMGIKSGRVRTSNDAYLAIEGLKKLIDRQLATDFGPRWKEDIHFGHVTATQDVKEYLRLHHCDAKGLLL